MKKLSLLLIAFLCNLFTFAQEIFQTNFQSEEEFQQWTVVDANADECTWQFDSSQTPFHVYYRYHSNNAANDWLISPAITSDKTGSLAVTFKAAGNDYGEKIEVFYGSEPTPEAMTNRITDVIYLDEETPSTHICLINANANEPFYLGFHACSDVDKYFLYLCDVNVKFVTNPVDIMVTEFVSPVTDFDLNQENVTVKVKNLGDVAVESFDISFAVDDVDIATETVNQTLAIGAELEYTFTTKVDLSEARKLYNIKAWTSHTDDFNANNDVCYTTVAHKSKATVPYNTSFETNEYTYDITFHNLNEDDGNWDIYVDPYWNLACTGSHCLAYNYDKNNSGDDWVIIGPISVEEAGCYMLRFWYSGDDSHPEKLGVYYGNEASPDAMTNKIVEYNPYASSSYQESINIVNVEEPQDIYIGFYAFSDKDRNWICIDDVSFEKINEDVVDIATLTIENPLYFVHKGTNKDITFKVRNLGTKDVTSMVNVRVDETTVYEETINILAMEIKDIVVEGVLKNIAAGEHTISVNVATADDVNESNNTQTLSFRVMDNAAALWDFEDGKIPNDFTFRVEDEGTVSPSAGDDFNEYGWGIFNIPESEYYGNHVFAGTSWLDDTEEADRWCVLPKFTPTEESFLVWDAASFNPYFLESYSVMISTSNDDVWSYYTEEEYAIESAEYKTRGLDLSGYANQDIFIAFRLHSKNCENLMLDNIGLYGGIVWKAPAAPVVTAEATSDTTVVLTWETVEDALGYKVYSADTLVVDSLTTTTFSVEGLTAATEYTFIVAAFNENGETKSEEVTVTTKEIEIPEDPGDGIEELITSVNIYPNPACDVINIETSIVVDEVMIYNVNGTVNSQWSTVNGQWSTIDVAKLEAGVYFIEIKTDEGNIVKRIIKN